jgi:hypothetical protein
MSTAIRAGSSVGVVVTMAMTPEELILSEPGRPGSYRKDGMILVIVILPQTNTNTNTNHSTIASLKSPTTLRL